MNCPNCHNTEIIKRGFTNGRQKYKCKICNASFTEGIPYKPTKRRIPTNYKCIYCDSRNVIRDGKLEKGAQRFKCLDCGKGFSTKSSKLKPIQWKCPYCNGELRYSGYGKLGQHEYKCKDCGRSCSAKDNNTQPTALVTFAQNNTTIKCPNCETYHIRLASKDKFGRQKYVCSQCGKSFTEVTTSKEIKRKHSKEVRDKVIQAMLRGEDRKKLSEITGYSLGSLQNMITKYYKNEPELTKTQKQLIYKFGVCLGSTAEYIAPYIGCSIHKVNEFMSKYKPAQKKTIVLTEKEKKEDSWYLEGMID